MRADTRRTTENRPLGARGLCCLFAIVGFLVPAVALPIASWQGLAPRDRWSTETKTPMIIYFRPGTPQEDINRFGHTVLMVQTRTAVPERDQGPYSGEWNFRGGITALSACSGPAGSGIRAICLEFGWLSGRSRDTIRAEAESWPEVLKVLEDVAPAAVTLADLGL